MSSCAGPINYFEDSSCSIFSAFDVDTPSPPEAAMIISNDDIADDHNLPITALVSTLPLPPTTYFDGTDQMLTDQYLAMEGQNFLVLEQPPERYLMSNLQAAHAGTQCLLEMTGSDESEEGEVDSVQFEALPSNTEEMKRKERRREQNRRAAQRCRARRKMREAAIIKAMEKEMLTMRSLESELQHLMSHKRELEMMLRQHGVYVSRTDHAFGREDHGPSSSAFFLPPVSQIFASESRTDSLS